MLIIYRKSDGAIASNSGTNSALPLGPSFESEVQNAIARLGGVADDYGGFRLHDAEDSETVAAILGAASYDLEFDAAGQPVGVTNIVPRPEPEPPPPPPDVPGFLLAARAALGRARSRTIYAAYPDIGVGLQLGGWAVARQAIDDALEDGFITQSEYDAISQLLSEHHIPTE